MKEKKLPLTRSQLMGRVGGKDTKPEMVVRRLAHAMGLRFRLHRKDLLGKPDLVFARHKTVIFVHGCFWHRHPGCKRASIPKTRPEFWNEKFQRNVQRDSKVEKALREEGWNVMILWECETRNELTLRERLLPLQSTSTVDGKPKT